VRKLLRSLGSHSSIHCCPLRKEADPGGCARRAPGVRLGLYTGVGGRTIMLTLFGETVYMLLLKSCFELLL